LLDRVGKKESVRGLKLTVHYRKMDADCPVPGRMIVIVDLSTHV